MTLSAPLEVYFRVDISFKDLETGSSTTTLGFTNRVVISSPYSYFPLLKSVSGLGMVVDQNGMPGVSTGTIVLKDPFESLGECRRVFDLTQRLTPINQTIEFYASRVGIGEAPSWSSLWRGRVASLNKSLSDDEQELTFEVESLQVETRKLGFTITSDMVGTPTEIGLGKILPIPIGESLVQMPAVQVTEGVEPYFYCYSQFGRDAAFKHFVKPLGTDQYLYARDHEGNYRQVQFWDSGELDPDVAEWSTADTGGSYSTARDGRNEILLQIKSDQLGNSSSTTCHVIHKARVRIKGQNNGALTAANCPGSIILALYSQSNTEVLEIGGYATAGKPEQELASGSVEKADYLASLKGASDFWVDITFNKPVVMQKDGRDPTRGEIYVSVRQTDFDTTATDFISGGYNAGGTIEKAIGVKGYTGDQQGDFRSAADMSWDVVWPIQLYSIAYEDIISPSSGLNAEGFAAKGFRIEQGTMGTNQVECPIDLDLVFETKGLQDDSSGTITGSASAYISYPHHVFNLLTREYDTVDFEQSSNTDVSTLSSFYSSVYTSTSEYSTKVAAVIEGGETIADAITRIAEEHAFRILQLSNGKLAIWPWGVTDSVSAVLWDEEISKPPTWDILGIDSIVNKVVIGYYPTLLTQRENESLYGFQGLQGAINLAVGSDYLATALSTISKNLYGVRDIEKRELTTVATEAHARLAGRYLLSVFDLPHITTQVSAPFWDYRTLELMDIVEIVSVFLPAYLGTSQNGRLPVYDGEQVEITENRFLKMAQRYRTQLVGKSITWEQGFEPTLDLTCRIISPYHENDPT